MYFYNGVLQQQWFIYTGSFTLPVVSGLFTFKWLNHSNVTIDKLQGDSLATYWWAKK